MNPSRNIQHLILVFGASILALLLLTTPVRPRAWAFEGRTLTPEADSGRWTGMGRLNQADLNEDEETETISLLHQRASIHSGGMARWQSPPSWQVTQADVTDLNRDGKLEATLLVWRSFRPWPVDQWLPEGGRIQDFQDAEGNSCQLILIGWEKGEYRELWAGSALAEPVRSFLAVDLDGDGRQELITLEGRYSEPRSALAGTLKVWEWNGFGFSSVYKMEGRFSSLAAARTNAGRILLLTP